MADGIERTAGDLRSFGRRRGRKLSLRQQRLIDEMLPRLAVDLRAPAPADLATLFESRVSRIWLEIGFGGAEHLLWQAEAQPNIGIIGAEPFEEGIVKALSGVSKGALGNVRLHGDDVRQLLDWLPDACLDRVFVLFPDPWPKKRHVKRRLVNEALLTKLARVIKPGGALRLATDVAAYARAMLIAARRQPGFTWQADEPADWRVRPADWPETRYEHKALGEGRRPAFLIFLRV
jgi:tRNA (guanine-N7-)-methyltransferase